MLKKAKDIAAKVLKFFRITDEEGLLSLTNITMMIVMYQLLSVEAVSVKELTALAIGVLGYQGKRGLGKRR